MKKITFLSILAFSAAALSGEKDGWQVCLRVRAGSAEEKDFLLRKLAASRAAIYSMAIQALKSP